MDADQVIIENIRSMVRDTDYIPRMLDDLNANTPFDKLKQKFYAMDELLFTDIMTIYMFDIYYCTIYSNTVLALFLNIYLEDGLQIYYFIGNEDQYSNKLIQICRFVTDISFNVSEINNYIFDNYTSIMTGAKYYQYVKDVCNYNSRFKNVFDTFSYIDHLINIVNRCTSVKSKSACIELYCTKIIEDRESPEAIERFQTIIKAISDEMDNEPVYNTIDALSWWNPQQDNI